MKHLFFVATILVAVTLMSCTKSDWAETVEKELSVNPVFPASGLSTRAAISVFPTGASLGLFVTSGTLGSPYNAASSNNNVKATLGSVWNLSPAVFLSPASAAVYAYYPYASAATHGDAVPLEHTTQTDYLFGTHTTGQAAATNENPHVNLTMKHALTLVQFRLYKTNYTGAGLLTKIEIANSAGKTALFSEGFLNIGTGAVTKTTGRNAPVTVFPDYTLPAAPSADENSWLKLLAMPLSSLTATGDVQILLTIDSKVYTYPLPAGTVWESGTKNIYTVLLSGTELQVGTVVIEAWKSGHSGSVSLK